MIYINEYKIYESNIEKDHIPFNYIGQIQYYFSDKNSLLPVRDVLNTQNSGFKTEPHIEIGAENFLKKCMQSNIVQSINKNVKYLFLLTRCQNRILKRHYRQQYIVGYIKIERSINRTDGHGNKWKSVMGETKTVSWDDAIPVLNYYTKNFDRPRISVYGKLDSVMVNVFLNKLKDKEDITDKIIQEIKRLDVENISCIGRSCEFYNVCKRWK